MKILKSIMGIKEEMKYKKSKPYVSTRILERLPLYHRFLRNITFKNGDYISTTEIAEKLQLNPIQVRKDIAATGIIGKPKKGFCSSDLCSSIEKFLGWDTVNYSILIGCGNLGSSLFTYNGLQKYGVNIIMAFDSNIAKTNKTIANKPVYHISELSDRIKGISIDLAIISVPEDSAQEIADLVVSNNIKAIWNFAPVSLTLPDDITLQQQDLAPYPAILLSRAKFNKTLVKI